jgi:hypothetical protein
MDEDHHGQDGNEAHRVLKDRRQEIEHQATSKERCIGGGFNLAGRQPRADFRTRATLGYAETT